jgi:hypothetical protein
MYENNTFRGAIATDYGKQKREKNKVQNMKNGVIHTCREHEKQLVYFTELETDGTIRIRIESDDDFMDFREITVSRNAFREIIEYI